MNYKSRTSGEKFADRSSGCSKPTEGKTNDRVTEIETLAKSFIECKGSDYSSKIRSPKLNAVEILSVGLHGEACVADFLGLHYNRIPKKNGDDGFDFISKAGYKIQVKTTTYKSGKLAVNPKDSCLEASNMLILCYHDKATKTTRILGGIHTETFKEQAEPFTFKGQSEPSLCLDQSELIPPCHLHFLRFGI